MKKLNHCFLLTQEDKQLARKTWSKNPANFIQQTHHFEKLL